MRAFRPVPPMLLLLAAAFAAPADAARLEVRVASADGPVAGAVVSLHGEALPLSDAPRSAVIDQVRVQFAPRVSVVETGASVSFPNSDDVLHHVYSFSPAKRFELPLYSGRPASPVVFDQPGVVVLGCNIHDQMIAYVVVLDTPVHAVTGADGVAVLEAPAGEYALQVWHERLGQTPWRAPQALGADGGARTVELAFPVAPAAPEAGGSERLRQLQERLRASGRGG